MFHTARAIHNTCQRALLYPLALSTLLCAVLIIGRVLISNSYNYQFLVWNLFLAALPYLFALWLLRAHARGQRWARVASAILWAIFLPNAPYIMTDFKHLLHLRPFPIMYDIVLIFAFAWTGLLLGFTSLLLIQNLVRARYGRPAAAAFVLAATLLAGTGVYIGRFLRWNSWDILTHPADLASTTIDALLNPTRHTGALAHSLVFTTVTLLCYLTFLTLRRGTQK